MNRERDRNGRSRREPVDELERHGGDDEPQATATQEQLVERPIEDDQERQRAADEPGLPPGQANEKQQRSARSDSV